MSVGDPDYSVHIESCQWNKETVGYLNICGYVKIYGDGRVDVSGDVSTAARQFWEAVRVAIPDFCPPARDASKYVIWSNQHASWWAPDRLGYTWKIAEAGLYTRREALEIVGAATEGQWRGRQMPDEVPVCVDDLPAEARLTLAGRI